MLKRFTRLLLGFMLLGTTALAQTNSIAASNKKPARARHSNSNTNTEQALTAILNEFLNAILKGDKAVYEHYLAPTYSESAENGQVRTRAEVFKGIQAAPASLNVSLKLGDVQVQDYGNTAVVFSRVDEYFEANGEPITQSFRATNVFMKQGGQWKLIAESNTPIPAEKAVAKVDPGIFDAYVGQYELAPNYILTVKHENDKLMAKATGQKDWFELLPENDSTFFVKGGEGAIVFVKDGNGQVTQIISRLLNGKEINSKKIK